MRVDPGSARYVSRRWGGEIIAVPAMIMALGIFLRFAGPYLLENAPGPAADSLLRAAAVALALFAVYVAVRYFSQFRADARVLWDYSMGHFRIGTWAAGANVLAAVLYPISSAAGLSVHALGWVLWGLYMWWLLGMVVRGPLRSHAPDGAIFLTTVATQSLVIGFIVTLPDGVPAFLSGLILLNVLGIIFYWISFAFLWVAGRFVDPLADWVPQNNITHGALSITILAAQMIEQRIPGSLPYFHLVIQVAWSATALLLLFSLGYELYLTFSGRKNLLAFRMGNYARNFTYGMFFACTYYGYVYPHPSIMKVLFDPALLTLFAILVLLINLWEVGHQTWIALRPVTSRA